MTGYGAGSAKKGHYEIKAEIKSLNSKFADITVRIPGQYSFLELILRKQIAEAMMRGKINLNIEIESTTTNTESVVDESLLRQYFNQYKMLTNDLGSDRTDIFSLALHSPGVLNLAESEFDDDLTDTIKQAVNEALKLCDKFRTQEGADLGSKLISYVDTINALLDKIGPFDENRIKKLEERLRTGLNNLSSKIEIDNNRLEQELIFYIEKLDLNEEKVRLRNHLLYFKEVANNEEANGKKLGFIAQEIGREINTIGSKANDANIQRIVVEMKEELEKIKEQVLNLV